MKNISLINFVVLVSLAFALPAFGQSSAQIEKELVSAIKEVQKYSNYGSSQDDEKLSKANEVFETKLLKYTKNGSTLQYKFSELSELLFVATSDDGKFRIYSWDREDGGTMHDYASVYQYQAADGKVYSKTDEIKDEESGAGSFVYDIFTVNGKKGKVYIACSTFIGSTKDHLQSAGLYKINGKTLDGSAKLFKTKSGLTNSLSFEYEFFSVVDRQERPVKLIKFDRATRTIKIPVVINDQEFPNGRVTNKFISYRFDGAYFMEVK